MNAIFSDVIVFSFIRQVFDNCRFWNYVAFAFVVDRLRGSSSVCCYGVLSLTDSISVTEMKLVVYVDNAASIALLSFLSLCCLSQK